jgi:energy-coupling factor transporter ATP-binding protein EcfA2
MDFYEVIEKELKDGSIEIYPNWIIGRSKDLMVRGRQFYAIWDEARGLWSTDEYDVPRLVDADLYAHAKQLKDKGKTCIVKTLSSYNSRQWINFRIFLSNLSDSNHQLDLKLTFANTEVKRSDYVSRRLPYSLEPGDYSAWDELVGTLYSVEERAKIEWSIGSIIAQDSIKIQKFLVLYGAAGTGKSTILNVVENLFQGYTVPFEAKSLSGNNNTFSMEIFKSDPLVAIQHDGDLSKIEDNTKLNSIVSHEMMTMNEKFKAPYRVRMNAFLFMGTNQPVKITDAKSGLIRRLIDVVPTGVMIPVNHYNTLINQIDFQLGAIACHCLEVYRSMGKNYYNHYRPLEMILMTDDFFNFIEAHYDIFKSQNYTSLKQAYALYKEYCEESGTKYPISRVKFRDELRNYFEEFKTRMHVDGKDVRSVYVGFTANKFKSESKKDKTFSLVMDEEESIFDSEYALAPAQYATPQGTPYKKWDDVTTTLSDLDTALTHYVKVPENHIVIDFDLKDEDGQKSLERNLEAASVWPPTYAEFSRSGAGVHLHYLYGGDVHSLDGRYSNGIEVKVFLGGSSLRRKLTRCNNIPIDSIDSGLPLKEKKVLNDHTIKSEKSLRDLIGRNLRKEIHPGTKPSVDFIHKILDDAYSSDLVYDVSDLRSKIIVFANNSTNRAMECIKIVQSMQFKSKETNPPWEEEKDERVVFFDVEVYPNLFIVCWKYQGDPIVVRMVNPSSEEIEELFSLRLVGFNNRRYDNHILYARFMGFSNEQLHTLSKKIIDNNPNALFGEAYHLSYADIYDFSSKKQGLKKFQIELGVPHQEMDLPWDEPVDEKLWGKVVDYCVNDVLATETVFEARKQDFVARQILAELSGLSVNDTTQKHTAKILFGADRHPQASFKYTDLSKEFEGYIYDMGKSTYRNEVTGEGGYVYAEPGIYSDVAVLDVASMHPTSIVELDLFGRYTPKFKELLEARLAIKNQDYETARKVLGGKLGKFLGSDSDSKDLSYALKIVINIVYGLTSARFDNPFRDPRNKDNIVAKRGALFMIDLKHAVQDYGAQVVHIKTDSIKIPGGDSEIIDFVTEFGHKYGYEFEFEGVYEKFCLVNDAVYIARKDGQWEAVGAQFQHPYVFKTLFTHEDVAFEDLCEAKSVTKGAIYLDFEHDRAMSLVEGLRFVGRTGLFVPVTPDSGGGVLYRIYEDKRYAVTGTKGYYWMEAHMFEEDPNAEIDMTYFEKMAKKAVKTIEEFGSFMDLVT